MKLAELVQQANKTYRLGLDKDQMVTVQQRLRMAGHSASLETAVISSVLDDALSIADDVKKSPNGALQGRVLQGYRSLKKEATASASPENKCPRCGDGLKPVKLVSEREARYCKACHITLPLRAEE